MNPLIQSKNKTILPVLITLTLACFALSPQARAVCQQGCDLANSNTFLGDFALISNTTGAFNTAIGSNTLLVNTIGSTNTATGFAALGSNTTGSANTATGFEALLSNTTGRNNTACGVEALVSNTTGRNNTACGVSALLSNTTGNGNTANGRAALQSNTTGDFNTATGNFALFSNSTGSENLAYGSGALFSNTTGNSNAAYGGDGLFGNTTGSFNVAVGFEAGSGLTTGDNNINIGAYVSGSAGESNTIRIGTQGVQNATYVAGIMGKTTPRGTPVFINANGQLGTVQSSARFKEQIKPMGNASEAILTLKPVTFRYKKEIDPERTPEFGLVAEDVEKLNPDLVVRDADGKAYTVRYEAVNAMLLNEFLKEHRTVQEQQKEIDALKAELKEQKALIQKVSDKVELNRPAPQMVVNNQ
jgi:endosialidase-like protein